MDTFHRDNFTGTWSRLFGRVKKHIIVGVVKSVMGIQASLYITFFWVVPKLLLHYKGEHILWGSVLTEAITSHKCHVTHIFIMQVKKFKDKSGSSQAPSAVISAVLSSSDSDDEQGGYDQMMANWVKRQQSEGAGDGFVSSVKGLFTSQKKKAKQFVLRTMRGDSDQDFRSGKLSDGEVEISPFARQLTIHKARKLIKQHTKKYSRSTANLGTSSLLLMTLYIWWNWNFLLLISIRSTFLESLSYLDWVCCSSVYPWKKLPYTCPFWETFLVHSYVL